MGDFGHNAIRGRGFFADGWGRGPFVIETDGKRYRFEDSDMFGPVFLDKHGDPQKRQPMSSRHPFWVPYQKWRDLGRPVAEDGITCLWRKPTYFVTVGGQQFITEYGDEGGPMVERPSPPVEPT